MQIPQDRIRGWDGIDHQSHVNVTENRSRLNELSRKALITAFIFHVLFVCFHWSYLENVMINKTN